MKSLAARVADLLRGEVRCPKCKENWADQKREIYEGVQSWFCATGSCSVMRYSQDGRVWSEAQKWV